jgi:beta-lactam-binding protein with PASTA domain
MKRISGILAIGVTALVLASGRTTSALEQQPPKTSKTPARVEAQVPDKSALPQQGAQAIRCTVPDLLGLNVSAARGVLEKAHLSLGDVDRRPDSHKTGTIIGQSAKSGTPVKCGLTVDIVSAVFTEPQQPNPPVCEVRVPDLFNVEMRSAEKILGGQKLKLGDIETKADTRLKGTVIGQLPPRGALVPCGTSVKIVVAVPPPEPPPCPPIKVPSLIGQDQETGITLLARAGLRVGNIERVKSEEPTGTILRQLPPKAFGKCEASIDLIVSVQTRVSPPPPAEPVCPTIAVPSVIGRDQETGIKLLAGAGLASEPSSE